MSWHVLHMAAMGLLTSALAPAVVVVARRCGSWLPRVPAAPALLGFVLLHAAVVLDDHNALDARGLLEHGALFIGAVVFWLPVLGDRGRLDPAARAVYLFLAAPALDLAAVVDIARGDPVGGIAMIVAMLPIGVTAVALLWGWIVAEERAAARAEV